MVQQKQLYKEAMNVLKATSRTFFIPITFLEKDMKTTVATAYLCMRAIDEIEDHEDITVEEKARMLTKTAELLSTQPFDNAAYLAEIDAYKSILPEVTLRLNDWIT